ncbi:Thivi_2564 family membrane protein [Sandarakinorhabdus rubra]|uniref:Thivi_2564 family membrane protein n=1 Tax=Sandarakinorhabdus rubra TaxID=2672568 RepID=UPI0013DCFD55|nr:Thivi_2564 family membrane protein [Sandarakinorhabdus rubra]
MLISTIITLIIVGVLLWLVNNKLPLDGTIRSIINIVVIIAVIVWLLRAFGLVSF